MINGIGVLGWGVGGIEAEASMLGQPISMLIPKVVGFKLTGELSEGTTATDLVLNIVEKLRIHGVVGKFVEFYGDGLNKSGVNFEKTSPSWEFYDLTIDPMENKNRINSANYEDVINKLHKQLLFEKELVKDFELEIPNL